MLTTLFPTHFFSINLLKIKDKRGVTQEYLDELVEAMDIMRKEDPLGRKISNAYTGWQSHDMVNDFGKFNPLVRKIKRYVDTEILPFFKVDPSTVQMTMGNMWANVNDYGAWNRPHLHNGCWYSGVFYIKTPKNSGNLCLLETGSRVVSDWPPSSRQSPNYDVEPEEGLLVLFPSGLLHMVEPNQVHEDRYTVAFNFNTQHLGGIKQTSTPFDFNFQFEIDETGEPIPIVYQETE